MWAKDVKIALQNLGHTDHTIRRAKGALVKDGQIEIDGAGGRRKSTSPELAHPPWKP